MNWKTIAIIFIILFGLLLTYNIWSVNYYNNEVEKTNICFYDICADYIQASYEEDICSCYEIDMVGEYIIAKTEYMKT